jgi:poly-gamma-glutamate capsule biosynthesis protein CapA/YwtB (metallophosphatase superfamily)
MKETQMPHALPSTPAEVLKISNPILRSILSVTTRFASMSGSWRHPRKNAATDVAEMGLIDNCYWVYKCDHPVTHCEKGERIDDLVTRDRSAVGLPAGFETQQSVTLGAAGDILQAEGLEQSKDILFENIADLLFGQDIAYANLESPITTQPLVKEVIGDRGPPTECCSRAQFDVLKGHKGRVFDVLNTSNNHAFDMGVEGVETTLSVLAEEGILETGTNRTAGQIGQGRILVKEGIKLGFVSSTFSLNGHPVPPEDAYRINAARLLSKRVDPDLHSLKQQIDWCKREGCDFIIASLHWGFEFEFFPRKRQIEAARELVEYGADAILCHHPHVIQPVEYYRTRRDPARVAVIAYSLGSLTWGFTAPHIALSLLLNLTLTKGALRGQERTYIEKACVTPIFRSVVINAQGVETRLEKLVDHAGGRSTRHSAEYIAQIEHYARLVLRKDM